MKPADVLAEFSSLLDTYKINDEEVRQSLIGIVQRMLDESHWQPFEVRPLTSLLFEGISLYGQTNWEPLVRVIAPIYLHAMENVPVEIRRELQSAIRQKIEANETSVNALLPFLFLETDMDVVSTSAIDFAMVPKSPEDDPIGWPRRLISDLEAGMGGNKGAIVGKRAIPVSNLTDFHVHPISEPRPYPVAYLRDNPLYPILIRGIANPNGPTLTVVTAVRDKTSAPLALVYAYLNPFRSELFIPGYLKEGKLAAFLPDQILLTLQPFPVFTGGVPTLCIPAGYLDVFDVRYLYSRLFANYAGLRCVLERLKRFPLNPWDRVSEEMKEAMAGFTGEQIKKPGDSVQPMSDEDMNVLLDIVLDPEHNKAELPAFGYSWKGSINQQKNLNNNELVDSAFQYDDFVPLLSHILEASGYEPE